MAGLLLLGVLVLAVVFFLASRKTPFGQCSP